MTDVSRSAQPESPESSETPEPKRAFLHGLRGRVRGRVLLLLCAMYFITYIDRVNIATAAPFIQDDLGLSDSELGLCLSAFAIPYAFFQIFGGWLGDRFGPRKVLLVVGLIWSASTIATGFSIGLISLFAARLALGFGEGATFPTATNAMARWMPPDRRAFAQGVTHAASRLGNAITPIIAAGLIALYDWRLSFWVIGVVSLVWVVVWGLTFHNNPADHPKMTQEELDELPPEQRKIEKATPVPWKPLLQRILPVTFVDFCYGWGLWVFLTWIPSFFARKYDLELGKFALFSALVLMAGVIGDTLGGVLSDSLLRRTKSLRTARRTNLVIGLAGSFIFVVPTLFIGDLVFVAICLSLSFFFLELTNSVVWAIPMDVAPRHAGVAGGLMNTGFGIAGIISPLVFGVLLDKTGHWTVPFTVTAVLLLVGVLASTRINPEPLESERVVA